MQRKNDAPNNEATETTHLVTAKVLEAENRASSECYAARYACIPWHAAKNALQETFCTPVDDDPVDDNVSETAWYDVSRLGSAAAVPVMYAGVLVSSMLGFFGGAARDTYHAARSCCARQEEEPVTPVKPAASK
jgi:hypothetical protein